tara:strand:- start:338 stop:631 length:294 start_codon:yes stop_codon:yes gene_type:complete
MQKFYQIIFFLILLGCSNKNYYIEKKPICNTLHNKNKISINCNEYNEDYHLIYDNLEKTFYDCEEIKFDIDNNGKNFKRSFLKCKSKNDDKNFIYLN